jgi:hypothetical protein
MASFAASTETLFFFIRQKYSRCYKATTRLQFSHPARIVIWLRVPTDVSVKNGTR